MDANDSFRDADFFHVKTLGPLWDAFLKRELNAALQRLQAEGKIKQDADGKWVPTDKPCADQLPLFDKGEST